jgi:hypothetical protein
LFSGLVKWIVKVQIRPVFVMATGIVLNCLGSSWDVAFNFKVLKEIKVDWVWLV